MSQVADIPEDFKSSLPPRKRAKTSEEKEQRRIERILRNRRAAHASREKKRKHVEFLEKYTLNLEQNLQLVESLNQALLKQYDGKNKEINKLMNQVQRFVKLKNEEDDEEEEEHQKSEDESESAESESNQTEQHTAVKQEEESQYPQSLASESNFNDLLNDPNPFVSSPFDVSSVSPVQLSPISIHSPQELEKFSLNMTQYTFHKPDFSFDMSFGFEERNPAAVTREFFCSL